MLPAGLLPTVSGVVHAEDEIRRVARKVTEESKKNNQRQPTSAEQKAIRLLSVVLEELAPEVMAIFRKGSTSYTVAKTEAGPGTTQVRPVLSFPRSVSCRKHFISDFPRHWSYSSCTNTLTSSETTNPRLHGCIDRVAGDSREAT